MASPGAARQEPGGVEPIEGRRLSGTDDDVGPANRVGAIEAAIAVAMGRIERVERVGIETGAVSIAAAGQGIQDLGGIAGGERQGNRQDANHDRRARKRAPSIVFGRVSHRSDPLRNTGQVNTCSSAVHAVVAQIAPK